MRTVSLPTTPPTPPEATRLGTTGAALFWLLLGLGTSGICLLAIPYSIGALVIFGPWAVASFAIAIRLLRRPEDMRSLIASVSLAAVSLALSSLGLVGTVPDYILWPITLVILSGAALGYSVLAVRAIRTDEVSPASAEWADPAIWAQRAALVLLAAGFAIVVGSFATWGDCSGMPCEGPMQFFVIFERSGIDFGPGLITAALGLLIVALAIDATRGRNRKVRAEIPMLAATAALVVVGIFVVRVYLIPLYTVYGRIEGLTLIAVGAVAALQASWRLRRTVRAGGT